MIQGRDLGDENGNRIQALIDRLEEMPKQGASYDDKGRHGWRNPIRADTGPLLQALVYAANPQNVLEIGTAHGLSLAYLASAAPKAEFTTIEWDQETATQAQRNLTDAGINVVVYCGDAMQVIKTLKGPYDMVFLDANKDGYLEQIMALQANGLLAQGCVIVADNVIDRQTECQNFLDYMGEYPAVVLPTECGLLVGRI